MAFALTKNLTVNNHYLSFKILKQIISAVPVAGPFIKNKWSNYKIRKYNPAYLLKKEFKSITELSIVQVGSNDGKTGDPIHSLVLSKPCCKVLFIEPVTSIFKKLKDNYPVNSKYIFENVAIGLTIEKKKFYYIDQGAKEKFPQLPEWYNQLGSFKKSHIQQHFGNIINDFIIENTVPVEPLAKVLNRHSINIIDIFHIDTEGYDWHVLQQLDLDKYSPTVILFEHKHLSSESKFKATEFLKNKYDIKDLGGDYYCKKRKEMK